MKIILMKPDGTVLDKKRSEFQKFRNYEALEKNKEYSTNVDMNEFFDDEEIGH